MEFRRSETKSETFWDYGIQIHQPIHIIVEKGRVTLTGIVHSQAERRKAEAITRATSGVVSVVNQLRIEEGE